MAISLGNKPPSINGIESSSVAELGLSLSIRTVNFAFPPYIFPPFRQYYINRMMKTAISIFSSIVKYKTRIFRFRHLILAELRKTIVYAQMIL